MRHKVFAACVFLVAGVLHAQHGTAPNGYFPMGFAGDMWTGEVSAVNDANREITLVYTRKKKAESFVGVLQHGYKVKLKDGSLAELKLSMIPIGTRLRVYYMAKDRKVDGRKEKFYEIFRIDFPPQAEGYWAELALTSPLHSSTGVLSVIALFQQSSRCGFSVVIGSEKETDGKNSQPFLSATTKILS